MSFSVLHELKGRLATVWVPIFSTAGLKHFLYVLTAHFGKWESADRANNLARYYHFVRPHESLKEELTKPIERRVGANSSCGSSTTVKATEVATCNDGWLMDRKRMIKELAANMPTLYFAIL